RIDVKFLDDREDVIPPARVERRTVVAELIEELVHLERRQDRLDQDRHPNRARRDAKLAFGERKDVVPETRLAVRLELRDVKVRTRAAGNLLARVMVEEHPEVEQARRHRLAVNAHVALEQVPATRTNQ